MIEANIPEPAGTRTQTAGTLPTTPRRLMLTQISKIMHEMDVKFHLYKLNLDCEEYPFYLLW